MRYTLSFGIFGLLFLQCLSQLATENVEKLVHIKNKSSLKLVEKTSESANLNAFYLESDTAAGTQKFHATSVLTEMELQLFTESLSNVSDAKCRNDLNVTLNGIQTGELWAIAMYDAMAKSLFGIENGILYHFGHFDECLDQYQSTSAQKGSNVPVHSKYCLTDIRYDGLTVLNIATRAQKPMNQTIAHFGACVPASCSGIDLENFLSSVMQRPVTVDETKCQMRESGLVVSNGMFAYAIILTIFIFLAFSSTLYHIYLLCLVKSDEKLTKSALKHDTLTIALLSFSVIENTKKLFQASTEQLGLNSINGIKSLAMLFILAGHALSFIFAAPAYNSAFLSENLKEPEFGFLSNSLLFVDLFLLLSGFLFCRILLIELERRRGKVNVLVLYAGRYIRLTPSYMAVMGFYMTWFLQLGSGPMWKERILREQERCRESWWLNALYINNYIQADKLCMFQSWYLCVDSQMFFLSPIVIYLLYKSRKHGLRFLSAMVILTAIIPFVITYINKLDPTLLVYADEMKDLAQNAYYVGTYTKTHMRASAYILGLLIGYCVHIMQENGTKLPKYFVNLAWILSFIIGNACMFSIYRFYRAPFTNLESTLYAGFHKIGWNLSVAWLVVAVTTGHAVWLENALSSRIFAPLSRLTYCAYLSNGIVELYHGAVIRTTPYMSYLNLTNSALCHIFDTFLLAFVLCLLFESPIHALERILLRKYGRRDRGNSAQNKAHNQTPNTSEEQIA